MHSPRHTRPVPAEWPQLAAQAQSLFPEAGTRAGLWNTWRLLRRVNHLDHERLETNYYYALGEAMLPLAARLSDAQVRAWTIRAAAVGMLRAALAARPKQIPWDAPFVPVIGDLVGEAMEPPFKQLAGLAVRSLPLPRRALIETVTVATLYRREKERPNTVRQLQLAQYISKHETTSRAIAHEAMAGATSVMGILLIGKHPEHEPPPEILAAPIDPAQVERLRYNDAFLRSTKLRIDEFMEGWGWHGDSDSLRFDSTVFASPPQQLEPAKFDPRFINLHHGRLGCPATQAGQLTLDVARHLLPEIIFTACELIPAQEFVAVA